MVEHDPVVITPPEAPSADLGSQSATVTDLSARRSRGPLIAGFASGIAAALALFAVLSVGGVFDSSTNSQDGSAVAGDEGESIELALAGTDLAPDGARADAVLTETALGTRIIASFEGLPPAEEGTYYEAWLRQSPEVGVSAGTFHLRGGDGEIELWSAVSPQDYPLFTVTIQQEGEGAASSGEVVLTARVDE